MTMRILIDTNIIIGLEDDKVIDDDFSDFIRYAALNNCKVYYHPDCLRDIAKDKNPDRRKIISSKFKKYEMLQNPAELTEEFMDMAGQKDENDRIDNIQLFQIYSGYVELFVTEDKGFFDERYIIG